MLGRTYETQVCSIARALETVGERWSILIIRNALFAGHTRFSDFQRSLGIASNVLATRLDAFVDAGIMTRSASPDAPRSPDYALTAKGRDLAPALIALTAWGDRWAAPDGAPIVYRHATCGERLEHHVDCVSCGRVREWDDVEAHAGPGMPLEQATRMQARLASGTRRDSDSRRVDD